MAGPRQGQAEQASNISNKVLPTIISGYLQQNRHLKICNIKDNTGKSSGIFSGMQDGKLEGNGPIDQRC